MALRFILATLAALLSATVASAQSVNSVGLFCNTGSSPIWAPCSASNPLNVTGTISTATTVTAVAALPSLSAGTGKALYESLSAGLFVQPIIGTNIVDATHGIPVVAQTAATWAVTQSTSPWVSSVTTWGGGVLGAMANYGTSPGAVLVPGVNAYITNTPAVTAALNVTPTIANGNGVVPAPSSAAAAGLSSTATTALAANLVVKASAGNLYSFTVSADSTLYAGTWYIMLYDATSAPGDGAVTPLKCYEMPANTYSYSAAFPVPVAFSSGITIGVSTSGCFTKTASTHAAFIGGDYK